MKYRRSTGGRDRMLALTVALWATGAAWAAPPTSQQHEIRNYDARTFHNVGFRADPSPAHGRALRDARAEFTDLSVTHVSAFSTSRSLFNRTGFLTTELLAGFDATEVALDYLHQNLDLLGLSRGDLFHYEVTDVVFSEPSGGTHVYLQQQHEGIPVYNGQLQVNVNRDGRIISVNNSFLADLGRVVNSPSPAFAAEDAVGRAAVHLQREVPRLSEKTVIGGPQKITRFVAESFSLEPVEAKLMWLPIREKEARLVWNFQVITVDGRHWFDLNVDAASGKVWTRFDWASSGSYRVCPQPVESPIHTSPLPPVDARPLVVGPEDSLASPIGWMSGNTMDGNNVHACVDANGDDECDLPEPACSGTICDFGIDLTSPPENSPEAGVSNLFYWNNIVHDIQYKYGFDETAGNFQEDNFSRGGLGSDSVYADALDSMGSCVSLFATPADGSNPRMQVSTCNGDRRCRLHRSRIRPWHLLSSGGRASECQLFE